MSPELGWMRSERDVLLASYWAYACCVGSLFVRAY